MSHRLNRRQALAAFGTLLASSPLLKGQQPPGYVNMGEVPGRMAPLKELVNSFEFEPMAQRMLNYSLYQEIAGGDRASFERITFRPRMMVPIKNLDLSVDLFGTKMYAPILAGPASSQKRFHADGELGMVRGASAAKTALVMSDRSSVPIQQIASEAKTPIWYQVYPEADMDALKARIQQAVKAGCKAVCITVGTPYQSTGGYPAMAALKAMGNPAADWAAIDKLRQGINVPFLLKGVMSPEEAKTAVQKDVQGIIVSNHGAKLQAGLVSPLEMLPSIADAVGGRIPVLIDGSFRRGSDVIKALALGAKAVLLTRPLLWGLTAYGAAGVQTVLELIQTEAAKDMAMCGKETVSLLNRDVVKLHRR